MRSVFFGSIFFSLLIFGCVAKPISSYTSENTKINSDVQTHAIDSIVLPYRNQMQAEMAEVIGYSDSTLLSYAPESPLGNFVADVIFETGFEFSKNNQICDNPHAVFSILNFGGLRKSIGQGEITRSDIYELMPFDNTIVIHPVSIAEGCTIENSIIGPNVTIGEKAVVRNSILRDSIIGSYSVLEKVVLHNSLIGSDALIAGASQSLNIGDNTEIDLSK